MIITEKIRAYQEDMAEHHRYRSWEHCYRYFHERTPEATKREIDQAALQLGFYLASWGMYRGSSFLLQYSYTVHRGAIEQLLLPRFSGLWEREFGAAEEDGRLMPVVLDACVAIREAYRPFAPPSEMRQASDTLVTKVILGTIGCLPACDRFFIDGFKSEGFRYSYLNAPFVQRILQFTGANLGELRAEQARIEAATGVRYPLMKLVDMYFWEVGYERELAAGAVTSTPEE